jgi:hypothetical protein
VDDVVDADEEYDVLRAPLGRLAVQEPPVQVLNLIAGNAERLGLKVPKMPVEDVPWWLGWTTGRSPKTTP